MSILDGLPRSEAEAKKFVALANATAKRTLDAMSLSAKARGITDLLPKGASPANMCDITSQERDALFAEGCRLVQAGEVDKGRNWLMPVYLLDPLDARVIYVIAVTYQMQGNVGLAAKLYVLFIALNATNPEGHLRLGECLLSAREYDLAVQEFQIASDLCGRGKGDAAMAGHAARMLAHADEKRAARRPARGGR